MDKEVIYTHREITIDSLRDFVIQPLSLAKGFLFDKRTDNVDEIIRSILNYKGSTEEKNIERIWRSYDDEQKSSNKENYQQDLSGISTEGYVPKLDLLVRGTTLVLPIDNLNLNILVAESNQIIDTRSFSAFVSERYRELCADTRFVPERNSSFQLSGVTKHYQPIYSCLFWCRSLSKNTEEELKGQMIDFSPFIMDLSYSTAGAGSFKITLPPITTEYSDGWKMKDGVIKSISEKGLQYVSNNIINYIKEKKLVRSDFYFCNAISENDLIFIRGDMLKIEDRRKQKYNSFSDLTIENSDIPGNIYDFIGLVDEVSFSFSASSNSITINVSGRSLYKLLIEDGCYFYPLQFINNGLFANYVDDDLTKRIDGKLVGLTQGVQKSIDFSLKFIFNALSNMRICPDSLFSNYANTEEIGKKLGIGYKSKTFQMNYAGEVQEEQPAKGIWQIIKLLIDDSVKNRMLVDSSIGNENGSIINHIDKVCQLPFVEFFGDTYNDQFYFIVRQPPFNKGGMKDLLSLIDEEKDILIIKEDDIIAESLNFDVSSAYSWYRLQPNGLIAGSGSEVVWAYLKAVYFKEYADIWGQRPLEITTNYVNYKTQNGNKKVFSTEYFVKQALFDLKFIVETNCYLPFTRKGTITINADRRIKQGVVVYRPSTDEIYYVDNVNTNFGISDRGINNETTLIVSRGMVRKHFNKYFEVINSEIIEDSYKSDTEKGYFNWINRVLQNWKVNKEIFNFFLRKEQFSKSFNMKSIKVKNV